MIFMLLCTAEQYFQMRVKLFFLTMLSHIEQMSSNIQHTDDKNNVLNNGLEAIQVLFVSIVIEDPAVV